MQKLSSFDCAPIARRATAWTLWIAAVGFGLYSMVLAPLYTQVAADVAYGDTLWPGLLYILIQIIEPLVFFLVYPTVIYALWYGGLRAAKGALWSLGLLTPAKYLINFIATCITDGAFPSLDTFVSDDLPLIGSMLALEMAQHALVVLIALGVIRRYRHAHALELAHADGATAAVAFMAIRAPVLPLRRMVSVKNPLQLSALLTALLLLLGRVLSHLIYFLVFAAYNGFSEGSLTLTLDLASDLVMCTVGYLLMVLVISSADRRDIERLGAEVVDKAGK